jgi:hypothetical protein
MGLVQPSPRCRAAPSEARRPLLQEQVLRRCQLGPRFDGLSPHYLPLAFNDQWNVR